MKLANLFILFSLIIKLNRRIQYLCCAMAKLYVGTAGWSYKDWVDRFYPKSQTADFEWLEFYSQYFNVVEVNSTYYTYVGPNVVDGWIRKVEGKEDFLFTLKLHQDFTHKRKYSEEQVKAVKYNLNRLANAGRLGGLLVQFPYSSVLNKENADYLKNLVDLFSEYDKFIEVRHKSWFIKRFIDFAGKNRSSLCTIDQPMVGESIDFNPVKAGDDLYIRFHGRNEKAWKNSIATFGAKQDYSQQSERYDYLYSPGELVEIEQRIKEVVDSVKRIFIILNNHPKGNAVANALELLHLIGGKMKINIPETTLKTFPRLSRIAGN
jgi:uncharacterized protein YecE (DUF72 family)